MQKVHRLALIEYLERVKAERIEGISLSLKQVDLYLDALYLAIQEGNESRIRDTKFMLKYHTGLLRHLGHYDIGE